MSWPSSVISPSTLAPVVSSCIRLRLRRNVVLPQPDDPISAVTLCGSIIMLTFWTAWKSP